MNSSTSTHETDDVQHQPKRQRCTKRVLVHETKDPVEEYNKLGSNEDQGLLYSTTVSRLWSHHALISSDSKDAEDVLHVNKTDAGTEKVNENVNSALTDTTATTRCDRHLRRKHSSGNAAIDLLHIATEESLQNKEPSPPPDPISQHRVKQTRRVRMNKSVKSAIRKLEDMQRSITTRRNVRNKDHNDDDCVEIIEPAASITGDDSCIKICVKIRSLKYGVQKFEMLPSDLFCRAMKYMSTVENVPVECIALYLSDKRVLEYETPLSLGLSVADILECYVKSRSSVERPYRNDTSTESSSSDSIHLVVQYDNKSKTTLNIGKDECMGKLMQEFCTLHGVDLTQVHFKLDDETIDPLSTPLSLALENGFCIDAAILTCID